MNEARDRGGGRVVIRRSFSQSRYATEVAASAYEIVVPRMRAELVRARGTTRFVSSGAVLARQERSCV
jgi:hypothetical protein